MQLSLFDRILEKYAQADYQEEVKLARDTFFKQMSEICEDHPSFERLTTCFLNWYVLDRQMNDGPGTPLQIFASAEDLGREELAECSRMAANVHSLFEVVKMDEGSLHLQDLFSREQIVVTERRQMVGLQKNDILEARLLPLTDKLVFSAGAFVLHPRAASALIHSVVERCRQEGEPRPAELISRLQAFTFRYVDQYRERVPMEKVFGDLV